MSKNHPNLPPALSFSGALSATLPKVRQNQTRGYAFPEHTRPFLKSTGLSINLFRSIVGQSQVESPNFAAYKSGKELWQEQSLT